MFTTRSVLTCFSAKLDASPMALPIVEGICHTCSITLANGYLSATAYANSTVWSSLVGSIQRIASSSMSLTERNDSRGKNALHTDLQTNNPVKLILMAYSQ